MRLWLLVGIVVSMIATPCYAWDGAVSGKSAGFEAAGADNYAFRTWLAGSPAMCGASSLDWAFVNKSHGNYGIFVSLLVLAYTTGKTVTLYTTKTPVGYCKVGHISVS